MTMDPETLSVSILCNKYLKLYLDSAQLCSFDISKMIYSSQQSRILRYSERRPLRNLIWVASIAFVWAIAAWRKGKQTDMCSGKILAQLRLPSGRRTLY